MEGGSVQIFSRSDKYRENWDSIFNPKLVLLELSNEEFLRRFKKHVKEQCKQMKKGEII